MGWGPAVARDPWANPAAGGGTRPAPAGRGWRLRPAVPSGSVSSQPARGSPETTGGAGTLRRPGPAWFCFACFALESGPARLDAPGGGRYTWPRVTIIDTHYQQTNLLRNATGVEACP
ncbi:hypothetical protein JCM13210_01220 [Thermaerobacter litoralis]